LLEILIFHTASPHDPRFRVICCKHSLAVGSPAAMEQGGRMSGMPPVITGRPSIGTAPLLHAGSAGGPQLQRRGSLALQGGSPTAAAGKHADVYLTELLSYSLDRLRKVHHCNGLIPEPGR
jgi:hypothetical protein